ncbi:MAG TPA: phosphoglucosamine mutase [Candidatus Binatia bacterium]|nr:phosphoglucosamine mutase [Candidatus Binatia bacterium]
MSGNLFGTDGIRGLAGEFPLDETTLGKLGRVLSSLALGPGIAIGRDTRASGATIETHLARGLGKKTRRYSCGVISTPGLAFLTRMLGAHFGIMISASHNPYRDNGIKVFNRRGEKISAGLESKISSGLKTARRTDFGAPGTGSIASIQAYMDFLLAHGRDLTPGKVKIVLDCANGSASVLAPDLFRRLGMNVVVRHAEPDGKNINAGCGSTCPQTLQRLVRGEKADLGIAFDGDADRVLFADSEGRLLTGDHALYLLALYLNHCEPKFNRCVVGTVMANLGLEKALAAARIGFLRSGVGDSRVYRLMKKNASILGGEPSGHIILKHLQPTGDGLLAALVFLKALEFFNWSGSELHRRLPLYPQRTVNVPIRRRKDLARWKALLQAEREFADRQGGRARLLIRYSGTEPLIRIMMEASAPDVIEEKLPQFLDLIKNEIGA